MPDELAKLRTNDGATALPFTEVAVNQKIAEETDNILREKGYVVEILPATVLPKYFANLFIAIHADGNTIKI